MKDAQALTYLEFFIVSFRGIDSSFIYNVKKSLNFICKTAFNYILGNPKLLNKGSPLFKEFNKNFFIEKAFLGSYAYEMYFNYQDRNYEKVPNVFESVQFTRVDAIELNYDTVTDFMMYYFYLGLINLNRKDFLQAALAFIIILKSEVRGVLNVFQTEAFKRLILLKFIVKDDGIDEHINHILEQYTFLLNSSEFHEYSQFNSFNKVIRNFKFFQKKSKFSDSQASFKQFTFKLKKDKTYGLAKLAFKEYTYNMLANFLRSYSRIFLNKVVQQTNIDKDTIISILREFSSVIIFLKYFQKQRINVKYDEESNIIEIISLNEQDDKLIGNLEKYYSHVINLK